jgi:hypothetical protein
MPYAMVIAMKKPKMVADLLLVVDVCIEASKTRAQLLESHGNGPQRRSMTIGKLTRPIMEIADIAGTDNSNPLSRRREDCYAALLT